MIAKLLKNLLPKKQRQEAEFDGERTRLRESFKEPAKARQARAEQDNCWYSHCWQLPAVQRSNSILRNRVESSRQLQNNAARADNWVEFADLLDPTADKFLARAENLINPSQPESALSCEDTEDQSASEAACEAQPIVSVEDTLLRVIDRVERKLAQTVSDQEGPFIKYLTGLPAPGQLRKKY